MGDTSCSSSSCVSFGSSIEEDGPAKPSSGAGSTTIKLLCSHSGKILPRYTDGKLRYLGGDTRVLSVDRSIRFSELRQKLRKLCGWDAVRIRCQLPTDDLDTLVSVTSDDDLANIIEAYDLAGRDKIRAILFLPSSKPSPPNSKIPSHSTEPTACQIFPPVKILGRIEKPPTATARDSGCRGHQNPHCHRQYHRHHHRLHGHQAISKPSNYLLQEFTDSFAIVAVAGHGGSKIKVKKGERNKTNTSL